MKHSRWARVPLELLWLSAFAVVYYAPLLLDALGLAHADARARALLDNALALPTIQAALLRNLGGHLLLLLAVYLPLCWLARGLTARWALRPGVARALLLVSGWLLLMAANGLLFPQSDYAVFFHRLVSPAVAAALALLLAAAVLAALPAFAPAARRHRRPLLAATAVALLAAGFAPLMRAAAPAAEARHVIFIGVDSLSPAVLEAHPQRLPHLAALRRQTVDYQRAYTPLARTFPAWMTILSGRSPAEHGAVFNLRNMEHVQREGLLTHTLAARGYHTVLAIDERRFSNIDTSFGFDRVVGPEAGALDFVLQRLNDTPLTNLLLQSVWARAALPFSHLNAASHANYSASGFVDAIARATDVARPVFLAAHFESAHFPFKTRHAHDHVEHPNRFYARHVDALTVVDRQVGQLMQRLAAQGLLNDALVVLLSDHGESLGDVEFRTTRGGEAFNVDPSGHGVELLSEQQSRVLLGFVHFKDGVAASTPERRAPMVSLADIRAVAERYAADGRLVPPEGGGCIHVETGIRLDAAASYKTLKESDVAAEAAGYYEIDGQGLLRLKESALRGLIETKDIGWRCADRITYFKHLDQRHYAYRIDDGGRSLAEVTPAPQDVERIEAYRRALLATARP